MRGAGGVESKKEFDRLGTGYADKGRPAAHEIPDSPQLQPSETTRAAGCRFNFAQRMTFQPRANKTVGAQPGGNQQAAASALSSAPS